MVEYLIDLIKPPRKLRFCEKKNGEISAPLGCSVAAIVDTHFLLQEGTDSEVSSQADVKKKKKNQPKISSIATASLSGTKADFATIIWLLLKVTDPHRKDICSLLSCLLQEAAESPIPVCTYLGGKKK